MKYWGADENDVDKLAGDERSSGCISSLDVRRKRICKTEKCKERGLYALETTAVDHLNIARGTSK